MYVFTICSKLLNKGSVTPYILRLILITDEQRPKRFRYPSISGFSHIPHVPDAICFSVLLWFRLTVV